MGILRNIAQFLLESSYRTAQKFRYIQNKSDCNVSNRIVHYSWSDGEVTGKEKEMIRVMFGKVNRFDEMCEEPESRS